MRPIFTDPSENDRILSPTDVEMSLRRSTRIHFNKGITILKDANTSSRSNQRSRCSPSASFSRKDEPAAQASGQASRV